MNLIITERGWGGHFCCASRCMFRRNTLLAYGKRRIVVSTVGAMRGNEGNGETEEIGFNRYYETMVFRAKFDKPYWDADVSKEITVKSNWALGEKANDNDANDMHEAVVKEIARKMKAEVV